MTLVTEVYKISKGFPKDEAYGLTSQVRRCATSITSNMAEDYGRNSTNEQIGKTTLCLCAFAPMNLSSYKFCSIPKKE